MLSLLLTILIGVFVVIVAFWAIDQLPVPGKQILKVIVILIVLIYILMRAAPLAVV